MQQGGRQERKKGRRGTGARHVTVSEYDACFGELIDVGREAAMIAKRAQAVGTERVRTNLQDIEWTIATLLVCMTSRPSLRQPHHGDEAACGKQRGRP